MASNDSLVSRQTSPARVVVQRRVELTDTDSTGHYHHSTVIRWVEAAEYVLHQRIGLGKLPVLPRVRYEADYRERLWRNDLVDIEVAVKTVGNSSVSYTFNVRRGDTICAEGNMIVVLTDPTTGRATPWPEAARQALLEAGTQPQEFLGHIPAQRGPDPREVLADPWGIGFG